jgi:hypothetical protein
MTSFLKWLGVTLTRYRSLDQYPLPILSGQELEGNHITLYRCWIHLYSLALQHRNSCVAVCNDFLVRLPWRRPRTRFARPPTLFAQLPGCPGRCCHCICTSISVDVRCLPGQYFIQFSAWSTNLSLAFSNQLYRAWVIWIRHRAFILLPAAAFTASVGTPLFAINSHPIDAE